MNKKLVEKYAAKNILSDEYNSAKESMPKEEFEKKYYKGNDGYLYKIEDISETELQTIILDKILSWVRFFGVLTVIGIIAAIILFLI